MPFGHCLTDFLPQGTLFEGVLEAKREHEMNSVSQSILNFLAFQLGWIQQPAPRRPLSWQRLGPMSRMWRSVSVNSIKEWGFLLLNLSTNYHLSTSHSSGKSQSSLRPILHVGGLLCSSCWKKSSVWFTCADSWLFSATRSGSMLNLLWYHYHSLTHQET